MQIVGAVLTGGLSLVMGALMPRPKLKPVKLSASTYGHMLKIHHGNDELGAEVLWQTDIKLTEDTVGKGAGGGTIIRGKFSAMLSFCEVPYGETRTIRRAWADGKLFYDDRPGATKKKKYKAPIRLYDGNEEQLPDPFMEAKLGVGLVQAYRGQCCMFLENFPLEDYGNRVPNFTAEVVQEFTPNPKTTFIEDYSRPLQFNGSLTLDPREGYPFVYAQTTVAPVIGDFVTPSSLIKINGLEDATVQESPVLNHWGAIGSMDIDNEGQIYAQSTGGTTLVLQPMGKFAPDSLTLINYAQDSGGQWFDISGEIRCDRRSDKKWVIHWTSDLSGQSVVVFDQPAMLKRYAVSKASLGFVAGDRMRDADFDADGGIWMLKSNGSNSQIWKVNSQDGAELKATLTGFPDARYLMWVPQDNTLVLGRVSTGSTSGLLKWSIDDEDTVKTLNVAVPAGVAGNKSFHNPKMEDTIWLPNLKVDIGVSVPPGTNPWFPQFTEVDIVKLEKKRTYTFTDAGQYYPIRDTPLTDTKKFFNPINAQYDPELDVIWAQDANGGAIGKFSLRGAASCVTLRSVVESYSARVGLIADGDIDASLLDNDEVCGLHADQQATCRAMLEPLLAAHAVDAVFSDDKIVFIPRGSASVIAIPQKDLASHAPSEGRPLGELIETRREERELPLSVSMTYTDLHNDYEQGHSRAPRIARNVQTQAEVTVELKEVFSNNRGQDIVDRMLYEDWVGRTKYACTLPPKYFKLNPTDVITAEVDDVEFTFRLTKVDVGLNYVIKAEGVAVDVAVYDGITRLPGPVIQPPNNGIPTSSASKLYLLDTPMLRESDNDAGFYVAVTPELGEETSWGGSVIFKSFDGLTYDNFMQDTSAATMGYAETALQAPDRWTTWDMTSSVTVKLFAGTAESFTQADLLNQKNVWLIGDEIVQPATATPIGDPAANRYTLSGPWIRGRKGTEWAIGTHVVGEKVVLLNSATLRRAFQPASEINALRYYEAATFGDSIDNVTAQQFTDTAKSLYPYSPYYIKGERDMSDNLTITWLRRSRYTASFNPLASSRLGEDSESYKVDILNGTTVVRTISATSQTAPYSAADQTTDFGSPQNSVKLRIQQVSAIVGRGFAREATI